MASTTLLPGEFELIERFKRILGAQHSSAILEGIGDDAAVVRPRRGETLVFTTDTLVERVHFDLRFDKLFDVGWKSVVASLSDIAAMNAAPLCAVVSAAFPRRASAIQTASLYRGIRAAAQKYSCPIAGGDTSSSGNDIFLSVAMLGSAPKRAIALRNGMNAGDLVCLSHDVGRAYAALKILQSHAAPRRPLSPALLAKHIKPLPRFEILEALRAAHIVPTAMIDVSDGLSSELNHLARQSGVRIEIDKAAVPIHASARRCAASFHENAYDWAMKSGEEYELLFSASRRHRRALAATPHVTIIGTALRGAGVWARVSGGAMEKILPMGYAHFY